MTRGKRESEWVILRRCLAILQRLRQGPADREELMRAVETLAPEAYPVSLSARREAFKRDKQKLREALQVEIKYAHGKYELVDAGPFFSFALSDQSLKAMMTLALTFDESSDRANIRTFLEEISIFLNPKQRISLKNPKSIVNYNILQGIDPNHIPPHVWETVTRALETRRELEFNYLSPRYEDKPKRFRIAPLQIVYQGGHFYLFGYVLHSETMEEDYRRFRIGYIQDDEYLKVLPAIIKRPFRQPPRYEVRYRLLPPLSRGAISQHFEEMKVVYLEDGSVEIQAVTADLFEAERILLSYGQYCIVLGGQELRNRIRRAIEGMCRNLQNSSSLADE
ncbi:MAG: WYL domain-containing protein [Chloroflexi bacterium]|jgi:predicted DNA-binding transcriptional regulator YafY|nr:WYL domain-containing protein [Chloroflexota bacterium]